jgi:putative nucleotidyltransferase with HDIG domain
MVGWMREELERRAEAVREVTVSALSALANALDMRSPYFQGHSKAVAMQAAAIAQALGCDDDEVEAVRTAGLLHDVGMMAVPDTLVSKPESLTPEEFQTIRSHCDRGVEILEPMKHLGRSIRYVHEHHERWDGSGYPQGKRGEEISLGGQIVGISEAWTAILESRAHRAGRSREEGLKILEDKRGMWFTAEVTDALRRADLGMI